MAVAGHLNGQLAEFALEGLLALAVAGVAGRVGHRFVAFTPMATQIPPLMATSNSPT
jgi:hypothetical protein